MARANAKRVGALVGDLASVEEIFALKDLMTRLGVVNLDCRQDGAKLHPKFGRASYLFNSTIGQQDRLDRKIALKQPAKDEFAFCNEELAGPIEFAVLEISIERDAGIVQRLKMHNRARAHRSA